MHLVASGFYGVGKSALSVPILGPDIRPVGNEEFDRFRLIPHRGHHEGGAAEYSIPTVDVRAPRDEETDNLDVASSRGGRERSLPHPADSIHISAQIDEPDHIG